MGEISRREFLETAGKGAAVVAIAAAGVPDATLWADPLGIPIGSQTYPVRARIAQGEFVQVLKDMFAAGIRQIELCSPGYADFKSLADGKQTRKIIEDNGLKCISSHFNYNTEFRNEADLTKAINWANDVGLTQMGTASLPATVIAGITSLEEVKRAADAYNKIAATARKAGIQQFLHNETLENSKLVDGRLTYPILLEHLDPELVKMQFQMSSMRTIGNPIMYFRLYPGRFISAHVHGVNLEAPLPPPRGNAMPIKPSPPPVGAEGAAGGARGAGGRGPVAPAVAIGDDSVDWPAVFTAAKAGGLKNYFIEQEQPNGGWEAMVKGAAYLKTLNVT
jgi:sugar phosphate isomerase/epimerase